MLIVNNVPSSYNVLLTGLLSLKFPIQLVTASISQNMTGYPLDWESAKQHVVNLLQWHEIDRTASTSDLLTYYNTS